MTDPRLEEINEFRAIERRFVRQAAAALGDGPFPTETQCAAATAAALVALAAGQRVARWEAP